MKRDCSDMTTLPGVIDGNASSAVKPSAILPAAGGARLICINPSGSGAGQLTCGQSRGAIDELLIMIKPRPLLLAQPESLAGLSAGSRLEDRHGHHESGNFR
jgi:hypothetical protein